MTVLAAIAALVAAGAIVPPILIRRSRDRLAAEIAARDPKPLLLTPADRCIGRFRRVPGVLGLDGETIFFESRLEPARTLPPSRIRRISSGNRMTTTGRRLFRAEVLTLVDTDGAVSEFLMPKASVYHWRQALGAWAAKQKAASAEIVRPDR
jgi:hypothetical protein